MISFLGWFIIAVGCALVIGEFIKEMRNRKIDWGNIGFLIVLAYIIYRISI